MDTIELDPRLRHATSFLGRPAKMLIDGRMVGALSGQTFEVYNPATGQVIADVPEADKADVDLAVAAARRAFDNDEDLDRIANEANDTLYGLAASVWTRDNGTAHKLAHRLCSGTV